MLSIVFTVQDTGGQVVRDLAVSIDENERVSAIIKLLLKELRWPDRDQAARPIVYGLRTARTGERVFTGPEPLRELNLLNGMRVLLGRVSVTGPAPSQSVQVTAPASPPTSPAYVLELPGTKA